MNSGVLYIVATPIGNYNDITLRALETLKDVDLIACEDTRKTRSLCQHFDIDKKLISYHDHNKEIREGRLIDELIGGKNIALVSDAGTPGINDPGFNIVRAAKAANIKVIGIPGACAAINALVTSGLPTDRFCYEGFLPVKKGRQTTLDRLKVEERTIILYESVHKIGRTLADFESIFPERIISLHREMTKIYEETIIGTASELLDRLDELTLKGEFTVIISAISSKEKKTEKINKYASLKEKSNNEL